VTINQITHAVGHVRRMIMTGQNTVWRYNYSVCPNLNFLLLTNYECGANSMLHKQKFGVRQA